MAENTNIGITVEAWAEITIKEWVKKAAMMGISPDDPLTAERFMFHVILNADGNPKYIEFIYDYYLMFVNWGVGKGVSLDNRDTLTLGKGTTRRPKPFRDDVLFKQLKVLAHLMAEKYALKAAKLIVHTYSDKSTIDIT